MDIGYSTLMFGKSSVRCLQQVLLQDLFAVSPCCLGITRNFELSRLGRLLLLAPCMITVIFAMAAINIVVTCPSYHFSLYRRLKHAFTRR